MEVNFVAPPTVAKFMKSDAFIKGLRGPVGGGKSSACVMEVFRRCQEQPISDKMGLKKRRSRWAIVRNTNNQLETTTLKTWMDWFPEGPFGKLFRRYPMRFDLSFGDIEAEIWFMALDKPDDVKRLLSLELTGAWVNEAREVPYDIIDMLMSRVGRYPPKREGGCTWAGILMDTNPPDEDSWWAILEGAAPIPDWWEPPGDDIDMFVQPPAMFEMHDGRRIWWKENLNAENLENLPDGYYRKYAQGKPHSRIRIYAGNKFGTDQEGQPVYPEFNEDVHVSKEPLVAIPSRPIIVGIDFGRTPAACFSQTTPKGQWWDLHELVTEGMGIEQFGIILKQEMRTLFPGHAFECWGDPAGGHGTQSDERTCFDILRAAGITVRPSPVGNNDWTIRREAGAAPLNRMVNGLPGYLIDPRCKHIIKGFRGGFRYRRLKVSGSARYSDKPEKNMSSHIHEARQYGYCGGGEARNLTIGNDRRRRKVIRAKVKKFKL